MNCPVCSEAMVVLELHEVEVDHCVTCKGIWLDSGELELLLEGGKNKEATLASFEKDKHGFARKKKCPECRARMEIVWCGGDKKICLDKCPKNHGLWFDGGELRQILKRTEFDAEGKIPRLLEEIFSWE